MIRLLSMKRLSLLFVALFGLAVAGTLMVQRFWIEPEDRCEDGGRWWYAEEGRCVTPVYIPDITGRAPGVTRAQASNEQNRELLVVEERLAAERAARDADADIQRARLRETQGR